MEITIDIVSFIILTISVLSIASLGGFIAEKAGIINFAIEGYMLVGAITYIFISQRIALIDPIGKSLYNQIWLVIAAGIVTSFISIIYAIVTIHFKANQIVASIAFNLLIIGIVIFLSASSINLYESQSQGYVGPLSIGKNTQEWQFVFSLPLFFAILIVIIVILFYKKSKFGYRIRAVGSNPHAANCANINVNRIRFYAILLSGFFGGLAGALYATFDREFGGINGLGFLAVAIWIFGQWKPTLVFVGSVLFGFLFGLVNKFELIPGITAKIVKYKMLLSIIPFVIPILSLIGISLVTKRSIAPKALGKPYPMQAKNFML